MLERGHTYTPWARTLGRCHRYIVTCQNLLRTRALAQVGERSGEGVRVRKEREWRG